MVKMLKVRNCTTCGHKRIMTEESFCRKCNSIFEGDYPYEQEAYGNSY